MNTKCLCASSVSMPHCLGGQKSLTSQGTGAKECFHNLHVLAEVFAWRHSFVFAHIKSEGSHRFVLTCKTKPREPLSQRQKKGQKPGIVLTSIFQKRVFHQYRVCYLLFSKENILLKTQLFLEFWANN